jgi:3-oxoacyl-[acyl-carrier protein] reductase
MSLQAIRHGVTVNALAPGLVQTPLLRERVSAERWADVAARQAVHRTLVPDDLLAALDFLVSDGAGGVTGTTVAVNGGRVWL